MTEILFMGDFEPAEFRKGRSDKGKKRSMRDRVVGTTRLGRAVRGGIATSLGVAAAGAALDSKMGRQAFGKLARGTQRMVSRGANKVNDMNNASRRNRGLNRLPEGGGAIVPAGSRSERARKRLFGDRRGRRRFTAKGS